MIRTWSHTVALLCPGPYVSVLVVVFSRLSLAGRGAAQAPDRPQIHQPWATRRLPEATSSAVRPTTTRNHKMPPMHRTKKALLLRTLSSSKAKRRRLVARRKPASSATCFHASPAAERRASWLAWPTVLSNHSLKDFEYHL